MFRFNKIIHILLLTILFYGNNFSYTSQCQKYLAPKTYMPSHEEWVAAEIKRSFLAYMTGFEHITAGARERFIQRSWSQDGAIKRLDLYENVIASLIIRIKKKLKKKYQDPEQWEEIKTLYLSILNDDVDDYQAKAFFNSISRRIFGSGKIVFDGLLPKIISKTEPKEHIYREYRKPDVISADLIQKILEDLDLGIPILNFKEGALISAKKLTAFMNDVFGSNKINRIQVLKPVFYRNKRAYLVARIKVGLSFYMPLVFACFHREDGVWLHALLFNEKLLRDIFGYTRSSFMVSIQHYMELTKFLTPIMPTKGMAAIFDALGLHMLAKTAIHEYLLKHLETTHEKFVFAPGKEGSAMTVFTLPTFNYVFKVIQDKYTQHKQSSREKIEASYNWVRKVDKVGRILDSLEFRNMAFKKDLFPPELLQKLLEYAPTVTEVNGDTVVIKHLYLQRRLTPLTVFLEKERDLKKIRDVIIDLGYCVRSLAEAGIYLKDPHIKNFGLTATGRVVLYDVDDLKEIKDCVFRSIHDPLVERWVEDESGFVTIHNIDPYDRPEELNYDIPLQWRPLFYKYHPELRRFEYWTELRERQMAGQVFDGFPYAPKFYLYSDRHRRPHEARLEGELIDYKTVNIAL